MPTYDYECEACSHHFERFQEMSAKKLRTCPKCGKRRLVRLVGAGAGVIFRGSGFYETDYKRKQGKTSGSQESASQAQDDGASSSSSSSSAPPKDAGSKSSEKTPGSGAGKGAKSS